MYGQPGGLGVQNAAASAEVLLELVVPSVKSAVYVLPSVCAGPRGGGRAGGPGGGRRGGGGGRGPRPPVWCCPPPLLKRTVSSWPSGDEVVPAGNVAAGAAPGAKRTQPYLAFAPAVRQKL